LFILKEYTMKKILLFCFLAAFFSNLLAQSNSYGF